MTRWQEYKTLARQYQGAAPGSYLFRCVCNEMMRFELYWPRLSLQTLLRRALRDGPDPT